MQFIKSVRFIIVLCFLLAIAGCEKANSGAGSSTSSSASQNQNNGNPSPSAGSAKTGNLDATFSLLNACLAMPTNQSGLDLELNHGKVSGNEGKLTDADKLNGVTLQADLLVEMPIRPKGASDWSQAKLNFVAEEKKGVITISPNNEKEHNDLDDGNWACRSRSGISPAEAVKEMDANRAELAKKQQQASHKYITQGGLTWMPITFSNNWEEANSYCTHTVINGQAGWRLPTDNEIQSLYHSGVMGDNMRNQGWTSSMDVYIWSSKKFTEFDWSPNVAAGHAHYSVSVETGDVMWNDDKTNHIVTCVR